MSQPLPSNTYQGHDGHTYVVDIIATDPNTLFDWVIYRKLGTTNYLTTTVNEWETAIMNPDYTEVERFKNITIGTEGL